MKSRHIHISDRQEEPPQIMCVEVYYRLNLAFNPYMLTAFIIFNVFAHVGAYGQTNIGRYTHGFTKTISVNHPQVV